MSLIERIVERLRELVGISEPLVVDSAGQALPEQYSAPGASQRSRGAWASRNRRRNIRASKTRCAKSAAKIGAARGRAGRGGLCELRGGADRGPERAGQFRSEPCRGARGNVRARERGPARRAFDAFPTLVRREIGACNAVTLDDYDRACDASTGLVWRSSGRWTLDGET